jgi:hypothetical protein
MFELELNSSVVGRIRIVLLDLEADVNENYERSIEPVVLGGVNQEIDTWGVFLDRPQSLVSIQHPNIILISRVCYARLMKHVERVSKLKTTSYYDQ